MSGITSIVQERNNEKWKEIETLERQYLEADKSFADTVHESTSCFACWSLKLTKCIDDARCKTIDNCVYKAESEVDGQNLTNELSKIIAQQSLSIKRSLMKLSNLISQRDLLNVPYYELKACVNQVTAKQKESALNFNPKMSFEEALKNLEQIQKNEDNIEVKTAQLVYSNKSISKNASDLNNVDEEYKSLPHCYTPELPILK